MRDHEEIIGEAFDLLTAYGVMRQSDQFDVDGGTPLLVAMAERWNRLLDKFEEEDVLALTLAVAEVAWQMAEVVATLDDEDRPAGAFIAASREGAERHS